MTKNQEKTCKKQAKVVTLTFNPTDTPVRMEEINDTLWFVARDVCKALNITWNGKTLDQIPDQWKGMRKFLTPGGEQEFTIISEAGMYKLAFRCNSSEAADKFTDWVASEVLPSIRKTGKYELSSQPEMKVCKSTQWRYKNGLYPKTTSEERNGDFDDVRDVPYSYIEILNKPVRTIEHDDENFFSIMDIKKALRITTDTGNIAASLCINKPFARKLFVFGATNPAWFCTSEGLKLLLSNKAKTNYCKRIEAQLQKGGDI